MDFVRITELDSHYSNLENKTVGEILREINAEDQKVALTVEKAIPSIEKLVEATVERMKAGGRLFYIGAGTSGRLGVLDSSEIPPTFGLSPSPIIGVIAGGDTALRHAVEKAEDSLTAGWEDLRAFGINDKDTVVGIAASGTTPYVVATLEMCRENKIFTGAITSNPGSPICRVADVVIELPVGPEYVTGSSRMKSGTAQKMTLNMISTGIMIRLGRVKGNKMVNMALSNSKLVDRGTRMVMDQTGLSYAEAETLLKEHNSVKKALDSFKNIRK